MKCNICGGELLTGSRVCKFCGNIVEFDDLGERTPQEIPTARNDVRRVQTPQKRENRENIDIPNDTRVYKQDRSTEYMFCTKCGRPLDGATGKCIVCDNAAVGERMNMNTLNEERNMAQNKKKTKKKKNTARNAALMTVGLIALFALAILFTVGPLSKYLGIGAGEPISTPMPTIPTVTKTQKPEQSTWEPTTDKPKKATAEPTEKPTKKPTKTPVPHEEGDPVELRGGHYEYDTNKDVITVDELDEMSRTEIKYVYWEIYARHGYTFDGELADYFENNHQWYMPTTTDIKEVEAEFSETEKKNKEIIYKYQKDKGWR